MITKNYKSIFSYIAALTIGFFIVSCEQETNADLSTFVPTTPTLSVTTEVSSASLIEDNSVYTYTATLSTAQLVDTKLYVTQISGDATMGADFTIDGSLIIPAGSLSVTGEIKILADELLEGTETVQIQIGDNRVANAALTPATMEFTILNYTEGDLVIDMGWEMSEITTDNSGNEISPTAFADLRLLVSTGPNNIDIIGGSDGGSFETYVMNEATPDGEYYIVADFYDANSTIIRSLNLDLTLNQAGVINNDHRTYSEAISNDNICANNFYVLAKITKSGMYYTTEDVASNNFLSQTVTWFGTDVIDAFNPSGYTSHVTTGINCDGQTISGLNKEWMENIWGETIETEGTVLYTVDGAGVVTMASQYIFTTLYSGSYYDYTVSGTGTYDELTGEMNIQYYLDQEGFSPNGWMFANGYMATDYFEANLTLAP